MRRLWSHKLPCVPSVLRSILLILMHQLEQGLAPTLILTRISLGLARPSESWSNSTGPVHFTSEVSRRSGPVAVAEVNGVQSRIVQVGESGEVQQSGSSISAEQESEDSVNPRVPESSV